VPSESRICKAGLTSPGKERKEKTLLGFFRWFGAERSAALQFICSDMWQPI